MTAEAFSARLDSLTAHFLIGSFNSPLFKVHPADRIQVPAALRPPQSLCTAAPFFGVQPLCNAAAFGIPQMIEKLEPRPGIEPGTYGLRNRRSTS